MPITAMRFTTPNWLLAGCVLSALFALPFNLMPIVLGSAADHFALDAQQIGLLASSLLGGWVSGTALNFWAMRFVSWRRLAIAGISLAVIGYSFSIFAEDYSLLCASWLVAGLGAPAPFCIALKMLTQQGDQERNMGIKLAVEVFLGAVLLYLFPVLLIQYWQYPGAALGMAVSMLLAFSVVRHIPAAAPQQSTLQLSQQHKKKPPIKNAIKGNHAALIALFGFLIFFGGQTGLWAFLERIGHDLQVTSHELGIIFSILKILGGVAGVITAVIGSRFGLRWPHLLGMTAIAGGIAILQLNVGTLGYALGSWLWEFGFALCQCYQMAAITRLDKSQRLIVLVPGIAGIGAFFGPALAGFLKTGDSYTPILMFTLSCSLIGTVIYLLLLSSKALTPKHAINNEQPVKTTPEHILN